MQYAEVLGGSEGTTFREWSRHLRHAEVCRPFKYRLNLSIGRDTLQTLQRCEPTLGVTESVPLESPEVTSLA